MDNFSKIPIIFLFVVTCSCNTIIQKDEQRSEVIRQVANSELTSVNVDILYSSDSSESIIVQSEVDTSVNFDDHLILQNDYIANQNVLIKSNKKLTKIRTPNEFEIDTIKLINNVMKKFCNQVVQEIFIQEYEPQKFIFIIKYAGFNNSSTERYYYFSEEGELIGEVRCQKNTCDTVGITNFKKNKLIRNYYKSIW